MGPVYVCDTTSGDQVACQQSEDERQREVARANEIQRIYAASDARMQARARERSDASRVRVTADARATWLTFPSTLSLTTVHGRGIGGNVPGGQPVFALGLDVSAYWDSGTALFIPFLGAGFGAALSGGSADEVQVGALTYHPDGGGGVVWLDLPGIGLRFGGETWTAMIATYGVAAIGELGGVVTGADGLPVDVRTETAWVALRADASICTGEAKERGVCVFAAPGIYEQGWMSSFATGLRLRL